MNIHLGCMQLFSGDECEDACTKTEFWAILFPILLCCVGSIAASCYMVYKRRNRNKEAFVTGEP